MAMFIRQENDRNINKRIKYLYHLICVLFSILLFKAFYIQVIADCSRLERFFKASNIRIENKKGERGLILDSNNKPFTANFRAWTIKIDPKKITNKDVFLSEFSDTFPTLENKLKQKLNRNISYPFEIKQCALDSDIEKIKKLNIKDAFIFSESQKRFYTEKHLAAQVLGFVQISSHKPLGGLEYQYNKILEGESYKVKRNIINAKFNVRAQDQNPNDYNGSNIVLTIDKKIQKISENILKEAIDNSGSKNGIAVIMEPESGQILSMAHFPRYNPNSYNEFSEFNKSPRAISYQYELGSVMKIFLAAHVLQNDYDKEELYFCENGKYTINNHEINDTHPKDYLTLEGIIKYSSNIGAVKLIHKIGKKNYFKTLKKFGFGEETHIDFPTETKGTLKHYSQWDETQEACISFGQGIGVSAIQLLTATSAIANGGKLMRPYFVKQIIGYDEDGNKEIKNIKPHYVRKVMSKEEAEKLKSIMALVVNEPDGTAHNAKIDEYIVCAKTGTAQKYIQKENKYSESKYIASIVGFAPKDKPLISVLLILDDPHPDHNAGVVVAPYFKKIIYDTISYIKTKEYNNL